MKVNRLTIENERSLRDLLDEMYSKAKEGEPFYGLLELVKNREVFFTAIHNIKSNRGSKTAGIDKKIVDEYLQMPFMECYKMTTDALDNYQPLPARRVYIPKGNFKGKVNQKDGYKLLLQKKVRPLGIPAMIDRTIQEMVRIVLEPIFEAQFFPHSYGFRPYRSTEHALAWIAKIVSNSGLYWLVEGDIKGYFDNINHNKLIQIMWSMGIKDKRIIFLIKKMLKAGYMDNGKLFPTEKGTPQGGIISPLLANIYLNSFDWKIGKQYEFHVLNSDYNQKKNALVARRREGITPIFFVRYADDWVIMTDTKEHAEQLKAEAEQYLRESLHLELSNEKTLVTDVRVSRAHFLGFDIKAGQRVQMDKFVARLLPNMPKLYEKAKEIKRDIRMIRTRKTELEKALDIEKVNSKIVGLSNYYKIGIAKQALGKLDFIFETTAYHTWVEMYGKNNAPKRKRPVSEFSNRVDRHNPPNGRPYLMKHFSVEAEGLLVGLTFGKITRIEYAKVFKQDLTPYSEEGRKLYENKSGHRARLIARPMLIDTDDLFIYVTSVHSNKRYNLEYFLNREYAYNRDKGQCKACETPLYQGNYRCHHIDAQLPLNKVNKVPNLASLCNDCHELIHNDAVLGDDKRGKKIHRYRLKYQAGKDVTRSIIKE